MKKLIVVLAVLFASFSSPLVRITDAPPTVLSLYRSFAAALITFPFVYFKQKDDLKNLKRKEILLSMLSGVFLSLHFVTFFLSLKYTTIASCLVLIDTEVFFVAFATLFLFKEKISKQGWIGIITAFLGSVIVAGTGFFNGNFKGDLIALSGSFFMACYTLIGKEVRKTVDTGPYTLIVYFSASFVILLFLLITKVPLYGYGRNAIISGVGMAFFCTFLGHSIYSWALKYVDAAFISTAKLLEPIFGSILAIFLFSEYPSFTVIIGGILILFGISYYAKYSK